MTIGIIGAGNMGEALCQAFVKDGAVNPKDLIIADPSKEKTAKIAGSLGVKSSQKNGDVLESNIILMAIKPQIFTEVSKEFLDQIPAETIIVSVMAGISCEQLKESLGHSKIVRLMPNTPVLVEEGVTAWYSNSLDDKEKTSIQKLLETTGYAFQVEQESQIDDVTALSGCGPGFFFHIFHQWQQAALQLDIPEEVIDDILLKTIKGSLKLFEESEDNALELAQKVASKGGATEKGLEVLEKADLEKTFSRMISAAFKRCKELGKS